MVLLGGEARIQHQGDEPELGWGRGGDRRCLTARASVGEDGVLCGWTRAGWGGVLQSNVKTLNTNVSTLNWTLKLIKTVKFTCYHKLFFVFF